MIESSHIQSANLRSTFTRYTSAILSIVVATAVRAMLDPILGNHLPLVTYFIAIMFSVWYSGRWPSWLALVLGYFAAAYFFVPPRWSLAVAGIPNQIGIGLYFLVGIISILLNDALRAAQRRAEASANEVHRLNVELEQKVKERTAQIETANERVRLQNAVLDAINKVFKEALICETEEELGKTCLAAAEELSGSKFGFFGELNKAGLFDTIAISNPGWDICKVPVGQATLIIRNMPIRGVDRSVLREGKSRIVNGIEAIKSHPDHVEVPKGHPPVTAFLGVPLKEAGKTIGMIGLGNREGGYTTAVQEDIEALAVAIVAAFKRKRSEILVRSLNKELSAVNKELEAFSYSVSHDLRAPLRAVDGFSNILLDDYRDKMNDEGKRLLNVVRDNTKKMGQLIEDIL